MVPDPPATAPPLSRKRWRSILLRLPLALDARVSGVVAHVRVKRPDIAQAEVIRLLLVDGLDSAESEMRGAA